MKKILYQSAAALLFAAFSMFTSCQDDSQDLVSEPQADIREVGEENCKEVVAGHDLHLEGEMEAEGLIARIDIRIAQKDGDSPLLRQSYTDGKYIGVKNATFHEHIDIPASATAGSYELTFTVTDKLGQSSTFTSDLKITAAVDGSPSITITEVGEEDSHKGQIGTPLHLEALIEAPHKIARIVVEIHNTAAMYEKEYTFDGEKYIGQTSVTFHEHPVIPADAPEGEYHIHISVFDANGNSTTEEAEGVEITK